MTTDNPQMILMSVRVEDNPLFPTRPGSYWLGNLVQGDEKWAGANNHLSNCKKSKTEIELANAWLLVSFAPLIQGQEALPPGDDGKPGGNQISFSLQTFTRLIPVTDYAGSEGVRIHVPVTHWVWPEGEMRTNLQLAIAEVRAMMMQRKAQIEAQMELDQQRREAAQSRESDLADPADMSPELRDRIERSRQH